MKFTKEELLEALKVKLTNGGKKNLSMSERSFNGKVERIYKRLEKAENNEEFELDDIVSEYLQDFEEDDNNIRNDNSAFVKEWKKNHSESKNNEVKDKKQEDMTDDESKIDLLLREIQGLKKEREDEKREREIAKKRSSLKETLVKKGVENKEWIAAQIELIHVDEETDIDALSEKLVNNFNKFSSETPPVITPKEVSRKVGEVDANEYADVVSIIKKQSNRE